jgi:phage tail-like protein
MADGFTVNARRYDPYKNYKFRVFMDGKNDPIMGVSKVGALKRTVEVVKHRHGNMASYEHKSPGKTTYDGITMERGITHDLEFEQWASTVHDPNGDALMDLAGYKKDLTLEVMNEQDQVAKRYFLRDAWVSEFTTLPDLDAGANAVAIESVKIEMEYWERDPDTTEPDESAG